MSQLFSIPGVDVLEELGRGAHSAVYRGRRQGRDYAVKVPLGPEDRADFELAARRFLREAVALARVRHPVLPRVLEVGHAGRLPYLILELAAGETLACRLRHGPLEEAQARELALQLSSALARVHDSGLIHRDIKPANILFDSATTAVRLVDFGLATPAERDVPENEEGASALELHGDGQSDLFALGCVLFECVFGVPFDADRAALLDRSPFATDEEAPVSAGFAAVLRRLLGVGGAPAYADARALFRDLQRLDGTGELVHSGWRSRAGLPESDADRIHGRAAELERLRAARRLVAVGQSQVVLIRGARGAGKTKLLRAFAAECAADGHARFLVRCRDLEHAAFSVVRQIVEALLDEYDTLPPAGRLAAIAKLRALAGDMAPLLRLLSPRLARLFHDAAPLPRTEGAEHIFSEGLSEFLGKLFADLGPTVVLIDDAHSLDAGSRRIVGRLSDAVDSSVLYVLAARDAPECAPQLERLLRMLEPNRVRNVRLHDLEHDEIVQLIASYLEHTRVDPELVRCVSGFSDGTPLSVLEVVRSMLDAGVLTPHWGDWRFDAARAAKMELPRGSLELVSRRIADLDAVSLHALSCAAVIGMVFEDALLSRATGIPADVLAGSMLDARHAMLLERASSTSHRFLHECVREALLGRLSEERTRQLHHDVAAALEEKLALSGASAAPDDRFPDVLDLAAIGDEDAGRTGGEVLMDLAIHAIAAGPAHDPERVLRACSAAGRWAFRRYDNEPALRCLGAAADAARSLGRELDLGLELMMAEARLRTGTREAGVAQLRRVVERTQDPVVRAYALSRIVSAEMQSDTDRAWAALDEAFAVLEVRPPKTSLGGALRAAGTWLRRLFRVRRVAKPSQRRRLAVLCDLFYQAARLGLDTGRPAILAQAVLRALDPAERLGPSPALNKIYLIYSFLLTTLGARRRANRYLSRAQEIASNARDPILYAFTLQVHSAIAAWAGDIREALRVGARSLDEYGHWRELSEYAVTAYNQQQIEAVRGRALLAWHWLDRAIGKISKHDGAPLALDFLELSARAALTCLGREHEADLLLSRLERVANRAPARGAVSLTAYGSQVRLYTERGDLGPQFESIVREVRAKNFDPRRVHLAVTEYYVHVAHARVHACLRSDGAARAANLELLREALEDLRRASRMRLLEAHTAAVEGYYRYFCGDLSGAEKQFRRAERLGTDEGAPWVLYAVHRGRAHMLREQGRDDAARDHARLAETLARVHGAAHRLRWIREEFLLTAQPLTPARDRASSPSNETSPSYSPAESALAPPRARSRAYLRALVKIGQCTASDLAFEQLAEVVLDELVEVLRAERGYLFLTRASIEDHDASADRDVPSRPGHVPRPLEELTLACARGSSHGEDTDPHGYDQKLVEDLWTLGSVEGSDDGGVARMATVTTFGDRVVVATCLVVRGGPMGVVYLDRSTRQGPFSDADARSLAALASQVPLVFELARSLRARERAEETQRSAEKLEAIGRLAGGIAHDFNNMLSVILCASEQILAEHGGHDVANDVSTIQSAAERARDLTRQLLAFSRGQYLNPEVLELNELIRRLEPIFKRIANASITVETTLDPDLCRVKADPAQLDQVLTNLVVNACDAMPLGGRLTIRTTNVVVPRTSDNSPRAMQPGRYACIVVSDTGQGMDETTRAKAFEPFFTTKASGSGLGLATAYGIVTQSGGHITIESELGVGTTFRVFLPETAQRRSSMPPPQESKRVPRGNETILVVDDEPMVRESTRRMLSSLGYGVITARSSEEALEIANDRLDTIDLVITDVVMPGMNGLELARELGRRRPNVRVLFVSGFTAGVLTERGVLRDSVEFLQKPITLETLASRIRIMLDPPPALQAPRAPE